MRYSIHFYKSFNYLLINIVCLLLDCDWLDFYLFLLFFSFPFLLFLEIFAIFFFLHISHRFFFHWYDVSKIKVLHKELIYIHEKAVSSNVVGNVLILLSAIKVEKWFKNMFPPPIYWPHWQENFLKLCYFSISLLLHNLILFTNLLLLCSKPRFLLLVDFI